MALFWTIFYDSTKLPVRRSDEKPDRKSPLRSVGILQEKSKALIRERPMLPEPL